MSPPPLLHHAVRPASGYLRDCVDVRHTADVPGEHFILHEMLGDALGGLD
jgi:hypothetical protein